ncbi:hypothetical protein EVJ58_g4222 [Rhodofomes roseus]|uniref:Uncharacterized protein n=1 Tax=Rhodofomes roseus TaxID=34475 RepID=A0A4Y9YJ99_9APHY|nr:hypothetical protein EVJ58_g4222 [Rhodofomes roseus]
MYEEVCLLCGRPVTVDGRAYCSDECESLDTTSPSISTSSSAYASPYLRSNNGPSSLVDVPALVSSAIGRSLHPGTASKHKSRHSISSSSTSSAIWSVSTEEEDELASAGPDEELLGSAVYGAEGAKSADPLLYPYPPRGQGLSYARRPSGTNQRSTIPTLNRHASATSSPFAGSTGSPRSAPPPYSPTEEEFPDVPQTSTSTRSAGLLGRPRRNRNSFASDPSSEQEADPETITSKPKRNRAQSACVLFPPDDVNLVADAATRTADALLAADSHSNHAVVPIITSHTPCCGPSRP